MEVAEPAIWKCAGEPTMLSAQSKPQTVQSMPQRKKVKKNIDRWPVALIVFGVALTIVWGGFLIWLLLHLLQMA
jgi:hypothetical protein